MKYTYIYIYSTSITGQK